MNYTRTGAQVLLALGIGCLSPHLVAEAEEQAAEVTVVLRSELDWEHLNPKRGDLAPKAGTLWGDRNGTGATGFLLKPSDGFESPPHIHNVSYRGVVIQGAIHNDDPDAGAMWMPAGSYWTQPKGHVHITAAQGADALAYIEINEGPYLVMPSEEAFDSGERPINMDERNVFWLGADELRWIPAAEQDAATGGAEVAYLWGTREAGELRGLLLRLPPGFAGKLKSAGRVLHAVVVAGETAYEGDTEKTVLEPGSYLGTHGTAVVALTTGAESGSTLYIRTDGPLDLLGSE